MTWNTLSYYISGQTLTSTDWNNYIGNNGNIAYLRNNYNMIYYSSFISGTTINTATATDMNLGVRNGGSATFTIPTSWGSGRYYYEATVTPNTTETIAGYRAVASIINGSTWRYNMVLPLAASGTNKMSYEYKGIESLSAGSTIKINFLQNSGANTIFNLFFIIQKVSL
jgi:hypothetical protein